MREPDVQTAITQRAGGLNESQQRRLRTSCQYIDKLLSEIESILHEAACRSPFPRHIADVSSAQIHGIEDYIRRVRAQLVRAVNPEPPDVPAKRAIASYLTFIDIAIEELKPRYMKGYGEISEDAARDLQQFVRELHASVDGMQNCLEAESVATGEKHS
jgi:hypothetical protein